MPEQTKEVWTYAGCRVSADNRLMYAYASDDNEDHFFYKPVGGTVLGGRYEVTVHREGDATTAERKAPYLGKTAPPATWVAKDAAARAEMAMRRWEARDKKHNPLDDMTLKEAKAAFVRLNLSQRTAFLASIVNYLSQWWRS